ncbi:MAG: SusC/RagA family TonB-linked outer membrane protein [Gemmatimonadota bacterium]|nr:SusC/RagA family TonB-linked outer membrane protein [Gemmatimonadota bacterium]
MNVRTAFSLVVRSIWLTAALASAPRAVRAQEQETQAAVIRGTVRDSATSEPVVGAQVLVLGSTRATSTDSTGAFALRVPAGAVTLRVQRLGYAPEQRTIEVVEGAVTTVDFRPRAVVVTLSEVQVIGYGTQDRTQVTGALSTIEGSEIAGQPVAGLDAALQGHVAGVQITQNSGDPGNGISIRIRGAASINSSNQPLFVIDGLPIATDQLSQIWSGGNAPTPLSGLDVNEIESITVLKDASSAAIYGSRAANGVVLITTKRGRAGKAQFSLDASTGWQSVEKQLPMMNTKQYVTFMNEASTNDSEAPLYSASLANTPTTNWQSAVFRAAPVADVHLGLSGGTGALRFGVDGSYFTQTGIELSSSYNRANARVNVDYDATAKFSLGSSLALSRENADRVKSDFHLHGLLINAIATPPVFPVRGPDGTYFGGNDQIDGQTIPSTNPLSIAAYDRFPANTDHVIGNLEANYHPTQSLTLTGRAGMQVVHLEESWWQSPLVLNTYAEAAGGIAMSGFNDSNLYSLEGFGTYQVGSAEGSNVTIVGGGSVELNTGSSSFIRGEGFSTPALQYVGSAINIVQYSAGPYADHNRESAFARANYSWNERYLLSTSLRVDGDSRFSPTSRWATFPAASAGWVISDESFMSSVRNWLGSLKLRGSFGETGNNNIVDFSYLSTYGSTPYGNTPGTSPIAIGNLNFRWELTKEWDAGADWSPFGKRISVIADYYRKTTSGLILARPLLLVSGYSSYLDNVGAMQNRGWELGLSSENFVSTSGGFAWNTDFNISFNHNEVTELYGNQPIPFFLQRLSVGQPLGEFYLYHFKGVDPATGDAAYSDSMQNSGSPQPKYWGGLGNSFTYKGFALRGFLTFSHGAKVFDLIREGTDDGGSSIAGKSTRELSRWEHPGDITNEPRASIGGKSGADVKQTDRFLEDGSYLRLQEVTLSWTLPRSIAARRGLENAKLYVSGHNLFTWTRYTGYDPDASSNGIENVQLGIDLVAYPRARAFTVGVAGQW